LCGALTVVAVIANGILVGVTFLVSLPAFALPTSRTWLKIHSWGVVMCMLFTLCLGLNEWIQTLTTRANLQVLWGEQTANAQSLLQQKVRWHRCVTKLRWIESSRFGLVRLLRICQFYDTPLCAGFHLHERYCCGV
jgi:hypothetical protein